MLTLAVETLGDGAGDRARGGAILSHVAASAGTINGMVGGQVADLEAEGRAIEPAELEYIHRSKTAALIRASVVAGGVGGRCGGGKVLAMENFWGENCRGLWCGCVSLCRGGGCRCVGRARG